MIKIIVRISIIFGIIYCQANSVSAREETHMTFLGVALDPETQLADQRLREYLQGQLPITFDNRDMEYSAAIQTLVEWDSNPTQALMARITPYVYVVAEILGANMEILGTYLSKTTRSDTYHSYLVVRRSDFDGNDLDGFSEYLRNKEQPARFIYHNKFSTSSFFLPSLYFSKSNIFSVKGQSKNNRRYITINAIHAENAGGSSDLVRKIKRGEGDFAAVWDGTKSKFQNDSDLLFLKLPNTLPNDLLVVSRDSDESLKDKLHDAIKRMPESAVQTGDFVKWMDFQSTPDARRALAKLRWMSKVQAKPVPIKIMKAFNKKISTPSRYIEAAVQSVQLSGTEFVVYDEDFHKRFDVLWTIEQTHDNSLLISSEFISTRIEPQQFHISFKPDDMESLVQRIGSEILTKMHRIRYVWPYDNQSPRILRDVNFDLPQGTQLKAVKITWNDISNNDFTTGTPFDVQVANTDFSSFQLQSKGFPIKDGQHQLDFDPMSNSNYRIILIRPDAKLFFIKSLTIAMIALFTLAAVFLTIGTFRKTEKTSTPV